MMVVTQRVVGMPTWPTMRFGLPLPWNEGPIVSPPLPPLALPVEAQSHVALRQHL